MNGVAGRKRMVGVARSWKLPTVAVAAAAAVSFVGCIHVLENGLTGKPTTPPLYGPPDNLAPGAPTRAPSANPWFTEEQKAAIAVGAFAMITGAMAHFSRKSTAKAAKA